MAVFKQDLTDPPATSGLVRREVLTGAAILALVLGSPVLAMPADRHGAMGGRLPVLRQVCQLVIPRTDTAGAGDVAVAEFVELAAAHGLEGVAPAHLDWLIAALDQAGGGNFAARPAAQQALVLADLDRAAYSGVATASAWRGIKALILTGYYTSEVGGSRELQYELVPGRYDPDIPLHPGDRAWSSDWTAVDFG